jgi:hypothetical protein
MIVRELNSGHSFKGAVGYITHDKDRAASAERVNWVELLNIRGDDPERAARQMAYVAMNADRIKEYNGIAAGRKKSADKAPVRHFTVSFHEADADKLTKAVMLEAATGLMKVYGIENHQAVIACHTDLANPHIHIIANRVDWLTGKSPDPYATNKAASKWAETFEKKHGLHIINQRQDNNRRRDEGERVTGEYEPKRQKGDERVRERATEPPQAQSLSPAPEEDKAKLAAELQRLQRDDWRDLSDSQKKEREAQFIRQRSEMSALWKSQREESDRMKLDIKQEAGAAYDAKREAVRPAFKKAWAEQFKKERKELKGFEHMGAIGRAAYYLKRMRDGSGVRIEHGVLKTFFNDKNAMKTLRDELLEHHAEQRGHVSKAQTADARAASEVVWKEAPERFSLLYEQQKEIREQKAAIHAVEREELKDRHGKQRMETREQQQDERRVAGIPEEREQDKQKRDALKREAEEKTRAAFSPDFAKMSLSERFKVLAEASRRRAKQNAKEQQKDKGRTRGIDRERDR